MSPIAYVTWYKHLRRIMVDCHTIEAAQKFVTMSVSLQFNYHVQNEAAKKAIEGYVEFLQKAFEQYRDLWEDHIKLQKKHEQCNVFSLAQKSIDESCVKTKNKLTIKQEQSDNDIMQENDNVPLLNLDTDIQNYFHVDTDYDANLSEDFLDNSPSKSPVFSKTHSKISRTSMKKVMQSSDATSVHSKSTAHTKMHCNSEKVPSKCNQKLELSTTYHVETTFLPNGKKLKQSQLVFQPVTHNKEKIPLRDTNKFNSDMIKKVKQKPKDKNHIVRQERETLVTRVPVTITTKDNATRANETFFEDVMEISPTQKNIQSEPRRCLKLKRKISRQIVENSPNKNEHYYLGSDFTTKTVLDDTDFSQNLSLKDTFAEMTPDKSLTEGFDAANVFKHNINRCNSSLTYKYSEADVKSTDSINNQRKNQTVKDKVQNIPQSFSDLFEERTLSENYTDDSYLDDIENKSSAKKPLLTRSHIITKKKENVPEQLNMRCKADRAKLGGRECWQCEEYYKNLSLSKEELQKRKNQCSRHRHKYERPTTPEGFWNPEFPESLSCTYRYNIN